MKHELTRMAVACWILVLFGVCACRPSEDENLPDPLPRPARARPGHTPKWSPPLGDAPLGYFGTLPASVPQGAPIDLTGWAVDAVDGAPVKRITVIVDGKREIAALVGLPREDVADTFGKPGLLRSGWSAVVNTFDFEPGEHIVAVKAENSRGRTSMLHPSGTTKFKVERR